MGDDVAEENVKTAIDEFARFYILNGCKDAKGAAIKAVVSLIYCYDCRRKHGFIPKDDGAHTAVRKKCECCGKRRGILGDRHWKPEYPNGMVLQ